MAQTSWPFHNPSTGGTPVYEDQWSLMARQWAASGVIGYPGDAGLQVYANGSGREVHVRAGLACARGHWFRSDAQETLAIAANTSGNPRIDRVVVRLDPSADEAVLAVLTGTPAGSPSAPTLTTTDTGMYELTLARVSVADGAATIIAGNVLDERVQVAPPALMGASSRLPQNPLPGQRALETDTGRDVIWDGSVWQAVTPAVDYSRAWRTTTPSGLSGGSGWQTIPFTNWEASESGLIVSAGGVITVPRAGIYTLHGEIFQDGAEWDLGFLTSTGRTGVQQVEDGGSATTSDTLWLPAGATVELQVFRTGPVVNAAKLSLVRAGHAALVTS